MKDFYEVLELQHDASEPEIKKAYRRLAIKYHPDKTQGDDFFCKKFIEVKEAYEVLINTEKRLEFDNEYRDYINQQTAEQKNEQRYQNERQKQEEKEQEEKFFYEPFKPFYSYRDRDLQETPQFKPIFDFWGEKLADNLDFLFLPKRIGKIIGAFSDLLINENPPTSKLKALRIIKSLGLALLLSTAIVFLGKPTIFWTIIWIIAPPTIAILLANSTNKFKHKNLFIGVNGFAEFECKDSRDNVVINSEVNFNDVTDLFVYQIETKVNYSYQGTDFLYRFFNMQTGSILYSKTGTFNKKNEIKKQNIDINFCRKVEQYWTIYLLDKLEETIQRDGFIAFNLYSAEKNIFSPYIKLGIGQITFIKGGNEEFTYKFNEIKKMYYKGSELHIQHLNFQRTLYFFKSGNEDIIPMLNLCNRQFFNKAMEILLGYAIN